MIDVIIITITLFLQWISNNFKVKITVWPENSIALLSISYSAASFWKSCLLQKSSCQKYVAVLLILSQENASLETFFHFDLSRVDSRKRISPQLLNLWIFL